MNKEEILKEIMELPKIETNNSISAMNGINVDDLMSAIDRLNKIPDYNDLLKENQKYKEVIDKLEFIKNRAISGATQETINKLAIDFVNSYLIEVE